MSTFALMITNAFFPIQMQEKVKKKRRKRSEMNIRKLRRIESGKN